MNRLGNITFCDFQPFTWFSRMAFIHLFITFTFLFVYQPSPKPKKQQQRHQAYHYYRD